MDRGARSSTAHMTRGSDHIHLVTLISRFFTLFKSRSLRCGVRIILLVLLLREGRLMHELLVMRRRGRHEVMDTWSGWRNDVHSWRRIRTWRMREHWECRKRRMLRMVMRGRAHIHRHLHRIRGHRRRRHRHWHLHRHEVRMGMGMRMRRWRKMWMWI